MRIEEKMSRIKDHYWYLKEKGCGPEQILMRMGINEKTNREILNGRQLTERFSNLCLVRISESVKYGLICLYCGNEVERVYQRDICKPCLIRLFHPIRDIIDFYHGVELV